MTQLPPPPKPTINWKLEVNKRAFVFHIIHEAVAYLHWVNDELNKVYKNSPHYTLHRQDVLLEKAAQTYGELLYHYDTARILYPRIFKETLYQQVIPRLRVMGYKPVEP